MRRSKRLMTAVVLAALLLPMPPAMADMYAYVDAKGVYHYSNVPGDRRYRLVRRDPPPVAAKGEAYGQILNQRLERNKGSFAARTVGQGRYNLNQYIKQAAHRHRIDPLLIRAIIKTESNFNSRAVSSKGAQGLMQLMPGTARALRVADPFDPRQNIHGGAKYLRSLLDSYNGNVVLSLAAYNAGPGRVKPNGAVPRIPETQAYVAKVLRYYKAYSQGANVPITSISLRKMVTVN